VVQLDHDEGIAAANEVKDRRKLIATVTGASRDYLGSNERAACGLELGFLGSCVLASGGDAANRSSGLRAEQKKGPTLSALQKTHAGPSALTLVRGCDEILS
jgi:hypothetical protein